MMMIDEEDGMSGTTDPDGTVTETEDVAAAGVQCEIETDLVIVIVIESMIGTETGTVIGIGIETLIVAEACNTSR